MGSYTDGVYVPAIGETGWGAAVNDFLTRSGEEHINVKAAPYGLLGNGTTESPSALTALQTAAVGKRIIWPPGTYKFPDSTGFTLAAGQHHVGVPGKTIITVKDAHAFTGTSLSDIVIDGFVVDVRAGASTGGAIKSISSNNNQWRVANIYADGGAAPTITTPLFHLQGWIGNEIRDSHASTGTTGFYLDATGFSNSNSVVRCRAVSQSTRGILVTGEGNAIRDSIWESNTGYGVEVVDSFRATITNCHFEDNKSHSIYTHADTAGTTMIGNAFWSYMAGAAAGTRYIKLVADGAHASRNSLIMANQFYNAAVMVEIGASVTDAAVLFNEGILTSDGTLVDSGTNTTILGQGAVKLPWTSVSGHFDLIGPASPVVGTSLLGAFGSTFNNGFYVTEGGYPVFRTVDGDPGTGGVLQNNSFVIFTDSSDSYKVKARIRKADGSYIVTTLGP